MLLLETKLDVVFLQIRDDSVNQGSTVLVLAAPSVDSLCAAKTLLVRLSLLAWPFTRFVCRVCRRCSSKSLSSSSSCRCLATRT